MKLKDKTIKYLIIALFIFLPIIDMLRTTAIKDVEIFNISILEFVNLFLIGLSFVLTIPKIKKKHFIYLIIFFIIVTIYSVFHIINTYNFDVSLFPTAIHSFVTEAYYIIRVYVLPLLLMIVLFENKKIFNRNYYINIMKYLVIFICGQIVILNIFRYSYGTYQIDLKDYFINTSNFFDVFKIDSGFKNLLTVGLFPSANQISLILFMILPLNIYNLYLNPQLKNILLVLLQAIAMIIIGTKVAALGSVLVLIATLLMYYFFIVIKREKFNKKYNCCHIICIIISIIILSISPFKQLYRDGLVLDHFKNDMSQDEVLMIKNQVTENIETEELVKILNKYPSVFKIAPIFYDLYPIENDREFWIKMAMRDRRLNNDYRILKNDIYKRVEERNNNKLDIFFGMGYTVGTIDMEKDYVYQYYLFGIFGLLTLVFVYIFFYFYNVLKILKKNYFNYNFCICLVPPFLGLVACYYSGHLFGWVSPMLILATTLCIERVNE